MRVVDDTGALMGVMPREQAVSLAVQKGLDLVEIAPKAKPPTCKIMDYGKWKFKMSKKEKHSRKNQIKVVIKEVQLRPRTDQHDFEIKMKKAKEFLTNGCKVKVHLRYSGREMAHKELGLAMLNRVVEELKEFSVLEKDTPQMERRSAFLFFTPNAAIMKNVQKKKKKQPAQKKPPAPAAGAGTTGSTGTAGSAGSARLVASAEGHLASRGSSVSSASASGSSESSNVSAGRPGAGSQAVARPSSVGTGAGVAQNLDKDSGLAKSSAGDVSRGLADNKEKPSSADSSRGGAAANGPKGGGAVDSPHTKSG